MQIILMADIVQSSRAKAKPLMKSFRHAVSTVNKKNRKAILSPLTITLGDEFQGVVRDVQAAIQIIFDLEQLGITGTVPFQLRYVVVEGSIDTDINKANAHGMLGPGLTEARERLATMKSTHHRFQVQLNSESRTEELNLMFVIMQGIGDQWTKAQRKVVSAFLMLGDYKKVAEKLKKNPTSAWRRQKSLMINEYNAVQKLMIKSASQR